MDYTFLLLSGGVGKRMQNSIPKQYMLLAGKPMIMHILEKVDSLDCLERIVIVCATEYISFINELCKTYGISKKIDYACSGKTRQKSVLSGLKRVETKNVIIHEAARPFVTLEDYQQLINDQYQNSIFGIRVPFTVVKGQDQVEGLLTRSELINVQLPQKFNTELIMSAHLQAEAERNTFTEDASLLYHYHPETYIHVVEGREYNLKITTRVDILLGEIIYDEFFRRRK